MSELNLVFYRLKRRKYLMGVLMSLFLRQSTQNRDGGAAFSLIRMKYLSLHSERMLDHTLRLLRTLDDGKLKRNGDFIFDKRYIITFVGELLNLTYKIIYELNSISRGKHLQLYKSADRIKSEFHTLLSLLQNSGNLEVKDDSFETDEEQEYAVLAEIIRRADTLNTTAVKGVESDQCISTLSKVVHYTISQFISHLNELIDAMKDSGKFHNRQLTDNGVGIICINIDDLEESKNRSQDIEDRRYEIENIFWRGFSGPKYWQSDVCLGGMCISCRERFLGLIHESRRSYLFQTVMSDDITSNYIDFLSVEGENVDGGETGADNFLNNIFCWLDFDFWAAKGISGAEIKNLQREEMEERLLILGKLTAFLLNLEQSGLKPGKWKESMEYFLDSVVE